ncbi:YihY/virulence factor BrkB family protein [Devosia rhizoryzae]|uniref:YihY/virulence factor BrkB family protein n=1 Tax=Devosia rhizoryzae TaxID=2774137 RepID=A0ABX7C6P9_9HYPH|nr:YihY/virulence factor BrkB family protein [Devosia rhizoryzae]QQR39937.1 YihY/virulence factor BrkB family protein [Devosia rhizoryzae]
MTSSNERFANERGNGRSASAPVKIPLRGWKDILWRLYSNFNDSRILLTAAGVTFYLLLSLVPTLTAFVSLYGLFNDRASVLQQVQLLAGVVPSGALQVLEDQLTRLVGQNNSTLGWTFLVALAIALWSASAGVKALFEAMNIAYHEREQRSFIKLNLIGLGFTLGAAIAAVLVLTVVVFMPVFVEILPGENVEWMVRIGSYVVMLVVISVLIAALYRWGPSREQAKWRWITPGAALSVIALGAGSVGFSWYVANFSNDNATYGSLGAVIGMMTWMWISTTLVIIGAVLNSEIEHQTALDTTTGPTKPLGSRGAFVADTIGASMPEGEDDLPKLEPRDRKRVSWGSLAFALPAALVLSATQRKQR